MGKPFINCLYISLFVGYMNQWKCTQHHTCATIGKFELSKLVIEHQRQFCNSVFCFSASLHTLKHRDCSLPLSAAPAKGPRISQQVREIEGGGKEDVIDSLVLHISG